MSLNKQDLQLDARRCDRLLLTLFSKIYVVREIYM